MDGRNIIGIHKTGTMDGVLEVFGPGLQRVLKGQFSIATDEEIDQAMELATSAFEAYKNVSGKKKAAFLNAIADEIMALGDTLVERAIQESGLPEGRIKGERGRTTGQLRLFAKVLEEGSWVEASIDQAQPDRQPMPKSDIRRMLRPIGPVVVFTASNFPLAFSTAGGDTASALASGCPVIVKAHESHLGTNGLVALAIQKAAESTGMPNGVFSSLNGTGIDLGQKLVKHPLTKAVAFTGSLRGGKAIYDTAGKREEPIPVFAEMGSINPVLLLNDAMENNGNKIAKQYAHSVNMGVGQFCTNPGLLLGNSGAALDQFIDVLGSAIRDHKNHTMLNEGICKSFKANKNHVLEQPGVDLVAESNEEPEGFQARPSVACISAKDFISNPILKEEVFGPFTLVVKCNDYTEMEAVINSLNGQLTGTVMGEESEIIANRSMIEALQNKVGRIIFNGVPTGVEVCYSMHHGGPYPATTDSRFTSVGTDSIKRFARPVCYQDCPQDLLPDELKDNNPLGVSRLVDGALVLGSNS